MVLTATSLIQWSTLGRIVLYSALIGIGIVALFSAGVVALSHIRTKKETSVSTVASYVTLALCNLAIVMVLVWGLYVTMHKS